ncbi:MULTISPECIES: restriction endonuclease subunit S [unclassified Nostoc]|uniref:restriction endonuclease subunit S n=1 Tax=unclassified Nostoc TaxID=2593658 RepID=UPI002AD1FF82|nr:restriction endonuclease subunit S [Nostoc sp. DedQUE03]MDZ7976414.1 restriction endonuclease subunit S [Nostoc sp. DedQUE03]MDZ8047585.1 restriction endonuclease subunit S [Nostoc sp. DedQUE02]
MEYKRVRDGEIQLPSHWRIVKLGDITQFKNGINFNKEQKGSGTLTVDVLNMYCESSFISMNKLYRVNIKLKDDYLLKKNDILFVRSSLKQEGVGWASLFLDFTEPVTFCGFIIRARLETQEIEPIFLVNYLRLDTVRKILISKSGKVGVTNISQANLQSLPIIIPPLPEQKTIAHTLRTIQKAKETRQRELELERERKAALMQYLFSYGTRNEPREEKEIGKIPKSWIVSRFESLCVLQRGFDITKKEQKPGKFPVISSGGISSYHNLGKVQGPGVIIGRKGTLGTVHYVDCDYWPHDTTLWVKEFYENNPLFIAYFLYFLNLKRFDSGASNPTLNRNTVHAMTIAYPKKEEQQEIAAILKACDRKIQALEKEIALTDELFHAMLEQLMTGKISTQPLTETYV